MKSKSLYFDSNKTERTTQYKKKPQNLSLKNIHKSYKLSVNLYIVFTQQIIRYPWWDGRGIGGLVLP